MGHDRGTGSPVVGILQNLDCFHVVSRSTMLKNFILDFMERIATTSSKSKVKART